MVLVHWVRSGAVLGGKDAAVMKLSMLALLIFLICTTALG